MKRHRLDPYALVFGLTFMAFGALMLDTDVDVADFAGAGWLPFPSVLLGLLLLAVGIDRARAGGEEPAEPAAPDEDDEV